MCEIMYVHMVTVSNLICATKNLYNNHFTFGKNTCKAATQNSAAKTSPNKISLYASAQIPFPIICRYVCIYINKYVFMSVYA